MVLNMVSKLMKPRSSSDFRNGIPPLLVLKLISQREMHGSEVVEALRSYNTNTVSIGEGIIYPVLHALEHDKLLCSRRRTVNGRSRICYAITSMGKRHLANSTKHWSWNLDSVRRLILGENNGQPA